MITPDVNVLLAYWRIDHPHHAVAKSWLTDALDGFESTGLIQLLPMVVAGFLRVVTHPKVFRPPTSLADGLNFLETLLSHPGVEMLEVGRREWQACRQLCLDRKLFGNAIADAWIAAAAYENGCRVVTFDRDFASLLPAGRFTLLNA